MLTQLLENVYYIPNSICKLCSELFHSYNDHQISSADISHILHKIYTNTQSGYAEKTAFLTAKQVKFLRIVAQKIYLQEVTSQQMSSESGISTRGLSEICKMLLDKGYIEREDKGIRIADPFFAYYLCREF